MTFKVCFAPILQIEENFCSLLHDPIRQLGAEDQSAGAIAPLLPPWRHSLERDQKANLGLLASSDGVAEPHNSLMGSTSGEVGIFSDKKKGANFLLMRMSAISY